MSDLANVSIENTERKVGDVFYFAKEDGTLGLWQALEDTIAGIDPNSSDQFMEITDWPNGMVEETKRKFSDIESFSKGDQIYYEGKYYQALNDIAPLNKDVSISTTSTAYGVGEVFNYNDQSFTVVTELPQGVDLSPLNGQVANGQTVKLTNAAGYSGEVQVAAGDPTVPDLLPALSTSRNFAAREVFEFEGNYYQALSDMPKGMDLSTLTANAGEYDAANFVEYQKDDIVLYEGQAFKRNATVYIEPGEGEEAIDIEPSDGSQFWGIHPQKGEVQELGSVIGNSSGSVLVLGDTLPADNSEDLTYPLIPGLDPITLSKGDVARFNDSFYMFVGNDIANLDPTVNANIWDSPDGSEDFIRINAKIDSSVKELDKDADELYLSVGEIYFHNDTHFAVKDLPYNADSGYSLGFTTPEEIASFDPFDEQWSDYILEFTPQLVDGDPMRIIRNDSPDGHITSGGSWVEVNLGIAEAVVQGGIIKDFKIINDGSGLPPETAVFLDGNGEGVATELSLEGGAIAGYQDAKFDALDKYRKSLNSLVADFVKQVNEIYNPTDEPGGYLFGFDAYLSRPVQGANTFLEETYGMFGKEGNGNLKVYDEEVDMTLPFAEGDTFKIVSSGNILPKELEYSNEEEIGNAYFRGGDNNESLLKADQSPEGEFTYASDFYAAARRMQHVTFDYDSTYPGEDKILTPGVVGNDDGRHLLRGYESIPLKINQGSEMYLLGDNFSFDVVLANEWNLASALRIDNDLSIDNIKSSEQLPDGANEIAFNIAKLGDGSFTEKISVINADLGNEMGDLSDNLEHQKSLQNLLLDQRRAVSSVSIDEEVADLMQFQRSFQASSRVLNTLDKMLELVVMGLIK